MPQSKRAEAAGDQVVPVVVLGHKADLAFMAVGEDLWQLRRLQAELALAGLDVVDSYVSLTELSEYAQGAPEGMREARLHPQLPPDGKPAWCFYPMSKRRDPEQNWCDVALFGEPQGAHVLGLRCVRAGPSPGGCCRSSPARPGSTTTSGA